MPKIITISVKYIKSYTLYLFLIILLFFFSTYKVVCAQNISLIQDAEIELYLRDWINPILKVAGLNPNSVNIYIVNDKSINAFVAGGQNIFINTGLFLAAKEVNALIGVLAHEIGHISGGHLNRTVNSMKKAQETVTIATILTAGLMAASKAAGLDTPSGLAKLATLGPSIAERNFYKHSRQNEKYADAAAIKYMTAVNRSCIPLTELLKKLGKQELLHENRQDPYLRSHPISQERIYEIIEATKKININDEKGFSPDNIKFNRIVAKIIAFTSSPGKTLLLFPKNSSQIDAKYARAIAYLRLPDLDKGIKEIKELINEYNNDPFFPEVYGQMLFENGQILESIEQLKISSKLLPNNPIILLSLARSQIEYGKKNENNEAILNLKKVLETMPKNIAAWQLLSIGEARNSNIGLAQLASAEAYFLMGQYNLAMQFAEKAKISFKKGSPSDIRALDIIFFSKEKLIKLNKN